MCVFAGLQTDFKVPWDCAATQWVCGDWSGSHLLAAGKGEKKKIITLKKTTMRKLKHMFPNKPYGNRS